MVQRRLLAFLLCCFWVPTPSTKSLGGYLEFAERPALHLCSPSLRRRRTLHVRRSPKAMHRISSHLWVAFSNTESLFFAEGERRRSKCFSSPSVLSLACLRLLAQEGARKRFSLLRLRRREGEEERFGDSLSVKAVKKSSKYDTKTALTRVSL